MGSKAALLVSVFIITCGTATAVFKECVPDSASGKLNNVVVSNCPASARRCILKRGFNSSLDISFTPSQPSETLTAIVHGIILDVPIPFDLPNPNGCTDCGVACPLQAGKEYKYSAKLPIKTSYPRVTVDIKWQLQDSEKRDIICAMIPAKIQ